MRQIVQLFITFLIILIQCGCNKVQLVTNPNKDFMKQLGSVPISVSGVAGLHRSFTS